MRRQCSVAWKNSADDISNVVDDTKAKFEEMLDDISIFFNGRPSVGQSVVDVEGGVAKNTKRGAVQELKMKNVANPRSLVQQREDGARLVKKYEVAVSLQTASEVDLGANWYGAALLSRTRKIEVDVFEFERISVEDFNRGSFNSFGDLTTSNVDLVANLSDSRSNAR